MPVEIRELIIRAYIDETPETERPGGGDAGGIDREEIIADCVEQVMEILRREQEP